MISKWPLHSKALAFCFDIFLYLPCVWLNFNDDYRTLCLVKKLWGDLNFYRLNFSKLRIVMVKGFVMIQLRISIWLKFKLVSFEFERRFLKFKQWFLRLLVILEADVLLLKSNTRWQVLLLLLFSFGFWYEEWNLVQGYGIVWYWTHDDNHYLVCTCLLDLDMEEWNRVHVSELCGIQGSSITYIYIHGLWIFSIRSWFLFWLYL